MDLTGKTRKIFEADMSGRGHAGLAWSPSGEEVWFSSNPKKGNGSLLSAISLSGKYREILPLNQGSLALRYFKGRPTSIESFFFGSSKRESYASPLWRGKNVTYPGWTVLRSQISLMMGKHYSFLKTEMEWRRERPLPTYIRAVGSSDAIRLGDGWPWGSVARW